MHFPFFNAKRYNLSEKSGGHQFHFLVIILKICHYGNHLQRNNNFKGMRVLLWLWFALLFFSFKVFTVKKVKTFTSHLKLFELRVLETTNKSKVIIMWTFHPQYTQISVFTNADIIISTYSAITKKYYLQLLRLSLNALKHLELFYPHWGAGMKEDICYVNIIRNIW